MADEDDEAWFGHVGRREGLRGAAFGSSCPVQAEEDFCRLYASVLCCTFAFVNGGCCGWFVMLREVEGVAKKNADASLESSTNSGAGICKRKEP